MPKELILKSGRERSLLRHHPWIFDGAVAAVSGAPLPGDTVEVYSEEGQWLARASYSPVSKIRARVWTFDQNEPIDQAFFDKRIDAATTYRSQLALNEKTDTWRLVHGEADGLPGCVIDRYGDFVVCQFLCAGSEAAREMIVASLKRDTSIRGIYERSDTDARERDGLKSRCGLLWGEEPPELFTIHENGIQFLADLRNGHKTGFYLDQRENRAALPCCHNADVLNCFCYTGGFGLRAAKEGAKSVTQVDLSAPALELAKRNAELNGFDDSLFTYTKADVFEQLRKFRDMGRQFDVVVLDPPKFAETPKQLEKAARGYKDINLLGAKLTRPGGFLLTFSCSGAMTPELFVKIVGDAARDAGRSARIVKVLGQAPDHPVTLDFPEGRYLTGLLLSLP